MKGCPFCGVRPEKHPVESYRNEYMIIYHKVGCYMYKGDFCFTLIPEYKLKAWQNRRGSRRTG